MEDSSPFDAYSADDMGGADPFAAGGDDNNDDPFGLGDEQVADLGAASEATDDPFGMDGGEEEEAVADEPVADAGFGGDFGAEETEDAPLPDLGGVSEPMAKSNKLQEWEEQHTAMLTQKRDAARAAKEDQRDAAKKEIEQFYTDRNERIAKGKSKNRSDEQNFLEEMASTMEFGTPWEKVNKLVDLQAVTGKAGESNTERMRNLLIQLKHEKK